MAIVRAAVAVDLREVSLRNKPAAMLRLSAKGTVPVLQCPDDRVIDESLDIMRWALQQSDPDGWLRHDDRTDLHHLLHSNDGPFKQALDRYKYAPRDAEFNQAVYRQRAETALIADLESMLARHAFIGGDSAGLIDVAIFPFVRQFAAVDADWFAESPWQHTRRWLRFWLASAWFTTAMIRADASGESRRSQSKGELSTS